MAQAFEIPKGVTGQRLPAYPRLGSVMSLRQVLSNAFFQIAAPDPTRGRIGTRNMGPPPDRRKRVDTALARSSASPIPGSAIRLKVNRFCRI